MEATIKELLIILGLTYCISAGLLGILIYVLIIARIVRVYLLHPETFENEEDHEL